MAEPTEEELNAEEISSTDTEEESSLRADLESAIETEETELDESTEKTEKDEKTDADEKDDEKVGGEKGTDEVVGGGEGERPKGINAPIGFSPESREKWKDVPDVIKEQVQKREKEITAAMANTAEARRSHASISKLAESYAPVLAAEGAETPMQAITALFKTVAELRMGTPQQSATKMAGLIKHYNIDIELLDEMLSGEVSERTSGNAELERLLDLRLAPVQDLLRGNNERAQAQAAANQKAVNDELQKFAETAEFLGDVRTDMADLIDLASKRGHKMSFEEAYKKACAMNPEISKVVEDRAQAEKLRNSGQRLSAKKDAASSIAQNSGAAGKKAGGSSLREQLNESWDAHAE